MDHHSALVRHRLTGAHIGSHTRNDYRGTRVAAQRLYPCALTGRRQPDGAIAGNVIHNHTQTVTVLIRPHEITLYLLLD